MCSTNNLKLILSDCNRGENVMWHQKFCQKLKTLYLITFLFCWIVFNTIENYGIISYSSLDLMRYNVLYEEKWILLRIVTELSVIVGEFGNLFSAIASNAYFGNCRCKVIYKIWLYISQQVKNTDKIKSELCLIT